MTFEPYRYFEHEADIGIVGRGATVEEALVNAARAMFAVMCAPDAVHLRERVAVAFEENDVEFALVTWLNLLLAHARERGLVLAGFSLERDGDRWLGEGRGERWHAGLERGTEVKGATLTELSVRQSPSGWEARCVVDV